MAFITYQLIINIPWSLHWDSRGNVWSDLKFVLFIRFPILQPYIISCFAGRIFLLTASHECDHSMMVFSICIYDGFSLFLLLDYPAVPFKLLISIVNVFSQFALKSKSSCKYKWKWLVLISTPEVFLLVRFFVGKRGVQLGLRIFVWSGSWL